MEDLIKRALDEDIGAGDITTERFVPCDTRALAAIIAGERCVIFGVKLAEFVFKCYDKNLEIEILSNDGSRAKKGDVIMKVAGSARSILVCERTALNFLGHLSGIATRTNRLVQRLSGTNTILLDTRKTTPLLRLFEKQAVLAGGGQNHRFGLYDMILVKDNHIIAAGGLKRVLEVVDQLKNENHGTFIEIEVSTIAELKEALKHKLDRIMLDNFTPSMVKRALEIRKKMGNNIPFEVSGGITERNIAQYAKLGVEYISAGCITHSVKSINFSLELNII